MQVLAAPIVNAVIEPTDGVRDQQPQILLPIGVSEDLLSRCGIREAYFVGAILRKSHNPVVVGIVNIEMPIAVHGEIARDEELAAFDAGAQHVLLATEGDVEELARRKFHRSRMAYRRRTYEGRRQKAE